MKAARVAVAGLTTALVGTGVAVATTGTAQAAGGGSVWDRVAACESGGNWSINTGNGFSGGLQFTPSTWRAYGGTGSAHNASRAEQIRVAQRVLQGQGPGAWPVCSRKAGLTRANGGAASSVSSSRSATRQSVKATSSTSSTKATSKVSAKSTSKTTSKTTSKASSQPAATTTRTQTVQGRTVTTPVRARGTAPVVASVNAAARADIKVIQRELGVSQDGILGPITARAIQKYVGVTQDGVVGRITVAAVEKKVGLRLSGKSTLSNFRLDALADHLAAR